MSPNWGSFCVRISPHLGLMLYCTRLDMDNSLAKVYNLISPGMRVYPGHGPDFMEE